MKAVWSFEWAREIIEEYHPPKKPTAYDGP